MKYEGDIIYTGQSEDELRNIILCPLINIKRIFVEKAYLSDFEDRICSGAKQNLDDSTKYTEFCGVPVTTSRKEKLKERTEIPLQKVLDVLANDGIVFCLEPGEPEAVISFHHIREIKLTETQIRAGKWFKRNY